MPYLLRLVLRVFRPRSLVYSCIHNLPSTSRQLACVYGRRMHSQNTVAARRHAIRHSLLVILIQFAHDRCALRGEFVLFLVLLLLLIILSTQAEGDLKDTRKQMINPETHMINTIVSLRQAHKSHIRSLIICRTILSRPLPPPPTITCHSCPNSYTIPHIPEATSAKSSTIYPSSLSNPCGFFMSMLARADVPARLPKLVL
jgi:hypothetical protein